MTQILGDGTTRSQRVRLGRALQGVRDQSFGQLHVLVGSADRKGRTLYALKHLEEPVSPYEARPTEVGTSSIGETHWVPYDEDGDDES